MRNLLMTAVSAVALISPTIPAYAADAFTIGVGQEGRGYEARGKKIAQRIPGSQVKNYEGSDDISVAVCDGEAQMGIMQIDAIYVRSKEGCRLQVVAKYGNEYAFILFPPESGFNEMDDLGDGNRILVDTIGSGTDLFWQNIKAIEAAHGRGTSWVKAEAVNAPTFLAQGMGESGDIDAVIIVGNPNSQEVLDLVEAGWDAGELRDKDIDDEEFNRKPLYERERVKIGRTGFGRGDKESAYVVPSFIVVNYDWMLANRKEFAKVARAATASK